MAELRLHLTGPDLSAVIPELEWQGERYEGAVVDLRMDADDLDELRWLWEDPSVDLYAPGSGRRRRAEEAASRVGVALGRAFASSEQTRLLLDRAFAAAQRPLVLVSSGVDAVLALPWELARTPEGLSLGSLATGVARLRENVGRPQVQHAGTGPLKVLLVVSRPDAEEDVAYRAVAAKLLERLDGRAEVTLVRPGTFSAFERMLDRGSWDLVHYDGHGIAGRLAFEDGLVDAERIGRVLARSGVPIFALNACQSAVQGAGLAREERETSSVARALVDTGAVGVVAMGASVRVTSAITFFDRFYEELARGETLSVASQRARRAIEAGQRHGPLDWAIPVLYLREDVAPFQGRIASGGSSRDLDDLLFGGGEQKATQGVFVGRDGDLYVLDRAVDQSPRVLLFGPGGIGKTTLVEHLLHWRERTGGADRVLSFSFRYAPPLEALAQQLQAEVEAARPEAIHRFRSPQWAHTAVGDRLRGLARVLASDTQTVRLFLFDNMETLAGYPEPGSGPYTDEDRAQFRGVMVALEGPGTRVVLTSRRDEVELLEDAVRRFPLRGVPGSHRLEMLQAYTEVYAADRRLREAMADEARTAVVEELLQELGGHPLATRVAAYGLQERTIENVLASIRGQAERIEIPEAEAGARAGSLEAAFAGALEALPAERRRALGVLGLFVGRFHEVDLMGIVLHEDFPAGVLVERTEESLRRVLSEARRLGLIVPSEELENVWEIVPGVQGTLEDLWRRESDTETTATLERYFVKYWAATALEYRKALHEEGGAQWALVYAEVDEGSLRKALAWAERAHDWRAADAVLHLLLELWPMQGRLKESDHLRNRWLAQVSNSSGEPLDTEDPSLVDLWRFLLGDLADREAKYGRVDAAEQIHRRIVTALEEAKDPSSQRNLAAGYHQMGVVNQLQGRLDEAEEWYRKSLTIFEARGDRPGMAKVYHQLGTVEQLRGRSDAAEEWYRKNLVIVEGLGDRPVMAACYHQLGIAEQLRERLDEAEGWYHKSLAIVQALGDRPGTARSYHHLGMVEEKRGRLDAAEEWYRKSLAIWEVLGDRPNLARTIGQLGILLRVRGEYQGALNSTLRALLLLLELNNPDASTALHSLGVLREVTGPETFEQLWQQVGAPPELLNEVLNWLEQNLRSRQQGSPTEESTSSPGAP